MCLKKKNLCPVHGIQFLYLVILLYMASSFFILATPFSLSAKHSLYVPLPKIASTFILEWQTGFFFSNANFTTPFKTSRLGSNHSFPSQNISQTENASNYAILQDTISNPYFSYADFSFGTGYAVTRWMELELFLDGMWFAYAKSGQAINRQSSILLTQAGAGAKWHISLGKLYFTPEINLSLPLKKPTARNSAYEPVVTDGSFHITPAFWLTLDLAELLYPFMKLGLRWRTNSLSSMLEWKLGIMLNTKILEFGANTYGFWSIIGDGAPIVDKTSLLQQSNAGSFKFYSLNPGVIGLSGWIAWHISRKFSLQVTGRMDLTGAQYAKGYHIILSALLKLYPKTYSERIFPKHPKSDRKFKPTKKDSKKRKRVEKSFRKNYKNYPILDSIKDSDDE